MIFFDLTKAGSTSHRSGLMRVSTRLCHELGPDATEVRWPSFPSSKSTDWLLTAELFSEAERPGFTAFLDAHPCRLAAIFHDAIPLKHPQITWPQSVARHPAYMKSLAKFDRVWAVSAASKQELEGFWRWQGLSRTPPVGVLALGADFSVIPRVSDGTRRSASPAKLLSVGIIEPRKNQGFLLEVCEQLWRAGMKFELHLVGRVNPHFGAPIVARIKKLEDRYRGALHWHETIDDAGLIRLYADTRATVFPTIAEGCGLPLLESLWMGVPCVCSDLPVLRENAAGGGCLPVAADDLRAWTEALQRIITDDVLVARLTAEATSRSLPTWTAAADTIRAGLNA